MTRDELESHYRQYIACLNARNLDAAERFYADDMLYNGARVSRAEWRRTAIEDSFRAMPDLRWSIEHLVIEGFNVAARLRDTGTLERAWRGLEPTGSPASFGENVFYRFRADGCTDEVWSIVDAFAMRG